MPTLSERLEAAVAQTEADSDILHEIINGTIEDSPISTEGGPVRTAAKAIADLGDSANYSTKSLSNTEAGSVVAALVASGAITIAKLASDVLAVLAGGLDPTKYQGTWVPATNTPTIPVAAGNEQEWYFAVAAGTATGNAAGTYVYGDVIVSNGTAWLLRPAPPTVIPPGSIARASLDADMRLRVELGVELTQRTYPAVSGAALGSNISAICSEAVEKSGVLSGVSVYTTTAGAATLFLCTISGSAATIIAASVKEVSLVSGANTITDWNPDVAEGQFVGVYRSAANIHYQSGVSGKHTLYATGLITTATALTTSTNNDMRMGWKVMSGPKAGGIPPLAQIQTINTTLSSAETTQGSYPAGGPGGGGFYLASGYCAIRSDIINKTGTLVDVSVTVNQVSAATLCLVTINGSNQVTLVASKAVSLVPGQNTIAWDQAVTAGQRIGVYVATGGVAYTAGASTRYTTGVPATNTASSSISFDFQIGWKFRGGLLERVAAVEEQLAVGTAEALSGAGLNQLAYSDNTGLVDVTTDFVNAIAAHPAPYVRPGSFLVSPIPLQSDGFWGPGIILSGGVNFPLPTAPRDGSLLNAVRSSMSSLTDDGSPHVLIGDSLSAHFTATALSKHFFNRIEDWLNFYNAPGTEPSTVVVRNDDGTTGETAAFYGITLSGVSNGARGPVGKSVILPVGAYLEFTGAYAEVDCFYQQEAGAGDLVFSFNGVTYKTVTCAGATALDTFSGPSATGQAASGIYRITAAGASVEVTGLVRHAALVAAAGTPKPIYHMRAAYGGYTGTSFNTTRLDSIIAQALRLRGGTKPEYTLALLTNDALFGTAPRPATYEANLRRIIAQLQAGGYSRINAISPSRPLYATWGGYYTAGQTFDTFVGILVRVCAELGVHLLRLDQIDFEARGFFHTDKLHWNDAGNQKVFEMFARWRAES